MEPSKTKSAGPFRVTSSKPVPDSSKANLKPISASHQKTHRRCRVAQRGVDQSGRGHTGAAGQRFGFHAAFVGSDGYFSRFNFLDKICVGPVWLKCGMIPDLRAPMLDRRRFDVVHEGNDMRHPGVNGMGRKLYAADLQSPAQDEVMRTAQRKLDKFAIGLGLNDSGLSLETDLRESSGDLVDKPGEASRAVPAHLRFAAVTIIISHPKIGFSCGSLDQKDSVRADALDAGHIGKQSVAAKTCERLIDCRSARNRSRRRSFSQTEA